jgi:hypothetical protein
MQTDLERFTNATIEALYFTDTGEEGQPPKSAEIHPETRLDLEADCRSFWRRVGYYVEAAGKTPKEAGHDFWLTRNGHGVGFWDGDWPAPWADILTKTAESYGPFETWLSDDGYIGS